MNYNKEQYRHVYTQQASYIIAFSYERIKQAYVTCSHEMSLNLKSGNLRYLQVSNLQVLLAFLILKSRFYSIKSGCDVFLKVACVAEAILRKSTLKFSLCIE